MQKLTLSQDIQLILLIILNYILMIVHQKWYIQKIFIIQYTVLMLGNAIKYMLLLIQNIIFVVNQFHQIER